MRFRDAMSIFHWMLTRCFLLNFVRAVGALVVAVVSLTVTEFPVSIPAALLFLGSVLDSILPFAILVATLFTVGSLARNQELTALKTAGWSLSRIMWPVILAGAAATVLSAGPRHTGVAVAAPTVLPLEDETALHAGRAYPLANLLAVLIGIPMAVSPRRSSLFRGFVGAVLVLVASCVVSATAQAFGRHGGLPPIVAGWLPTAAFAAIAGLLWRRADR